MNFRKMSYFIKTILLFYTTLFILKGQDFGQQGVEFGKNIVQYSKFDWHYIQTKKQAF